VKLDVVVEIAICVLIVWKKNACAIHFFLGNTCYPLHIVFQGGQSKEMMISLSNVVSDACGKVWGDCQVLLFKFCVCVFMLLGEKMCALVIGNFEVGVVVLKFNIEKRSRTPKHYFILVILFSHL
jgi:hypothetical protein